MIDELQVVHCEESELDIYAQELRQRKYINSIYSQNNTSLLSKSDHIDISLDSEMIGMISKGVIQQVIDKEIKYSNKQNKTKKHDNNQVNTKDYNTSQSSNKTIDSRRLNNSTMKRQSIAKSIVSRESIEQDMKSDNDIPKQSLRNKKSSNKVITNMLLKPLPFPTKPITRMTDEAFFAALDSLL